MRLQKRFFFFFFTAIFTTGWFACTNYPGSGWCRANSFFAFGRGSARTTSGLLGFHQSNQLPFEWGLCPACPPPDRKRAVAGNGWVKPAQPTDTTKKRPKNVFSTAIGVWFFFRMSVYVPVQCWSFLFFKMPDSLYLALNILISTHHIGLPTFADKNTCIQQTRMFSFATAFSCCSHRARESWLEYLWI